MKIVRNNIVCPHKNFETIKNVQITSIRAWRVSFLNTFHVA